MSNPGLNSENYHVSENENSHEDKNGDKYNDTLAIKNILLYKNGDLYFPGKRFVMNRKYIRNWESFLEELTKNLNPVNGAIRDIRTPYHGTIIRSLDDLTTNGKYVAVSKGEKLKLIDYTKTVNINTPPQPAKSKSLGLKPLRLANHDMEKIESRITQDLYVKSSVIFVYRNGDPFTRAIKIVIKPQEQKHMSILVKAIEDRVLLQTNKPIRRLYTLNGDLIKYAKDVEDGKYYVAASFEDFKNIKYGQFLPVIRGGRVSSKRNQIKFLNQMPSGKLEERSQRSTVDENSNQPEKPVDSPNTKPKNQEKRSQKTNAKQKNEKEKAATKIQAAFRGFHTRKEIEKAIENNELIPTKQLTYVPKKTKIKNSEKEKETVEPEKSNKVNYNKIKKEEKVSQEKPLKNQTKPKKDKVETKKAPSKKDNSNVVHSDDEFTKAAIKIQAGFRGYQTRHNLKNIKSHKPFKNTENQNVNKVQSKSENNRQDKNNKNNNDNRNNNHENKEEKAAVIIQAGFRGYHTRKTMKNNPSQKLNNVPTKEKETNSEPKSVNNKEEEHDPKEEEKAAIKIQAGFRGYRQRQNLKNREHAAQTIQAGFRGFKTRKLLKQNAKQMPTEDHNDANDSNNNEQEEAAKRIQAGFRGFKVRKELKFIEERQKNAATKIQAGFRGYKTRKEFKKKEKSAERIQAGFRSYKTRKGLSNNTVEKPKYLTPEEQAEERNEAAAKIQAAFRGHIYRRDHN